MDRPSGPSSEPIVDNQAAPLLMMGGVHKAFPGVVALDGASLRVMRGEVHAVVGQNGAGKSTLMKILNGAHRRDGGSVELDGKPVDFRSTQAAQTAGVSTIFQEINLVPFRSVAENIWMGREPRAFGFIRWREMNRKARELLVGLGVTVDVTRPLAEFNVAVQQMVAIARAVSFDSKLVIMDEPTSSLDDREVETLFGVIRSLKANNVSVIFITHRLDELWAVCDRVTIMRDGRTVAEHAMSGISRLDLVAQMLGKDLRAVQREGQTGFTHRNRVSQGALLAASGLVRGRALRGASVTVGKGEIVGLAGLLGSGRTEVARVVFGVDHVDAGEVSVEGQRVSFADPRDAIRAGMGFCSEDRKSEGIVPYLSVRENLTLAALPGLSKAGVIDKDRQMEIVDRFIARLGIKTAGPDQPIRELSGGNQQKVLLARWLCLDPKLLILDEPTRGIDIGAKAEIQRLIGELADRGLGVLMISSEIEELIEGGDRVVVLRDGATVAELHGEDVNQNVILEAMAHGATGNDLTSESGEV